MHDGRSFGYDECGNLIQRANWVLTWEHGRQLASIKYSNTTWTHEHNVDGLRTYRSDGTTTYTYVYNGSSLSQMTVNGNTLYFVNDTVTYNGTTYYYVKNLQGDVVAILDASGNAVVEYTYNAWGVLLSTTGSMASTLGVHNPLRYRGYVYDNETELYYLQSRYYDPDVGRFINADALVSTGQGILGNNMFAYCLNNPVMRKDESGQMWQFVTAMDPRSQLCAANYCGVGGAGSSSSSGYYNTDSTSLSDILAVICSSILIAGTLGNSVCESAPQMPFPTSTSDEREQDVVLKPTQLPTVIYRYYATKTTNLAPRKGKDFDGLSFSTTPPKPGVSAVVTTIEQVNATGILRAFVTGGSHVLVVPTFGTVLQWMTQGQASIWSYTLSSIVLEWSGE